MAYDKFSGDRIRLLVLEGTYWVDQACIRAAEALGWDVKRCPVKMIGTMPREMVAELFEAVLHHRPDFILSVNLSGMDVDGMLANFLADLHVPHVTWFVDGPRAIMAGNPTSATPYTLACTWEPAYVPFLASCGFGDTLVVPLALDDHLFRGEPTKNTTHPPTFVGDSMIYHAGNEWTVVRENPALLRAVQAAFDAGRVTREGFAAGVDAVLGDDHGTFDGESRYHAERIFFIEGTRRLRHALIDALSPHGLHVRGDAYWEQVTPHAGPPVDYHEELPDFYPQCAVNLNSTSVQMATAVNQRVFDAPAAGGFLLTDHQAQLDQLFDIEREVVTYTTLEEAREKMTWFIQHPKARCEIVRRAQRRILQEHTYRHRITMIADRVRARFAP
jgi:spore maturation protein CgeB